MILPRFQAAHQTIPRLTHHLGFPIRSTDVVPACSGCRMEPDRCTCLPVDERNEILRLREELSLALWELQQYHKHEGV